LNISLSVALNWFIQNRLKVNPSKTEMVVLQSSRQHTPVELSARLGQLEIVPTKSVKLLGVKIDSHLSWDVHVSSVVRRCNRILIGLARLHHKFTCITRLVLIEALVFPHIRYCVSVWGSCSKAQKRRIQKCINFGARIVAGLHYRDHVSPTLKELGWLKLDDIISEADAHSVFKIMNEFTGSELIRGQLNCRSTVSQRSTRATANGELQVPRCRTEFARRSFIPRACRMWNNLPPDVRNSGGYNVFRRRLSVMLRMSRL